MLFQSHFSLSSFRQQQILQQINKVDSSVKRIHMAQIVLAHCLNDEIDVSALETLLDADKVELHGEIIVPRIGTISPWSSKATDIVKNASISGVKRVEQAYKWTFFDAADNEIKPSKQLLSIVYDKMTHEVLSCASQYSRVFDSANPEPLAYVDTQNKGKAAILEADQSLGLALGEDEVEYLLDHYNKLGRNPTDAELMMFAQANSEHCRHKIFNATWSIDGIEQDRSLFKMIKNTYEVSGDNVLSAYSDNASVTKGPVTERLWMNVETGRYEYREEPVHMLMKVETHNHPTAIAPFPGAGTGSGGEIRDEGAVGRGSKPKVGLTGFSVSNLNIPEFAQPWESGVDKPDRICSALDIMLQGPIGGAAFNNEFGRPNISGYFRTYEQIDVDGETIRGYHKPIMIAGGFGNVRDEHVHAQPGKVGMKLVVIGGPAMEIGLGGGAASSQDSGSSTEDLDFASVQRQNPEMERRAQEVIDRCASLGEQNPIALIHDVGAGGLSNAFPELIDDLGMGGEFELRKVPSDEPSMTPLAVWCNESQERYVIAVHREQFNEFVAICERERCPYSAVGEATDDKRLVVKDEYFSNHVVDLPLDVLLGKTPQMHRSFDRVDIATKPFDYRDIRLEDAIPRVLRLPAVASKSFLITIGDRSVTGQVVRDQMVGPWQVPVADYGMTTVGYQTYAGEAMSMGERTPSALISGPASGRMAIAEVITNLAGVKIDRMSDIKLSANWMAAAGHGTEDQALYDTVKAVGMALCPELGLTIPVGKDSLSMKTKWQDESGEKNVVAPMSLVVSGFTPVPDVRQALTPELQSEGSSLFLIDVSMGQRRMGASSLAQVYNQIGDEVPDIDDAASLKTFFALVQQLVGDRVATAYHDRSDGGVFTTVLEMAFAARRGVAVELTSEDVLGQLFNEEAGAVVEIPAAKTEQFESLVKAHKAQALVMKVATTNASDELSIQVGSDLVYRESLVSLQKMWSETSFKMQSLRDNPECAKQEFNAIANRDDPGIRSKLTFDAQAPMMNFGAKPQIAILREQGVNGQMEMAAAFMAAGFESVDVHMSDILTGRVSLKDFSGLAACGGFSYGDVLGAGRGWAKTILNNHRAHDEFSEFFARNHTFSLGVCNGCQMMSQIKSLIPGAQAWPSFERNLSEQFEARVSMVEVAKSNSVLLGSMAGSILPVAVAHGEGRAVFSGDAHNVSMRYIDGSGAATEVYPANPNGSAGGITAVCSEDGRSTIMMPHPERVFRSITNSSRPASWGENGPWLEMFKNARRFVG